MPQSRAIFLKNILKGLDRDSKVLTDCMVGHILFKNIKVFKLALANNVVVSKEGLKILIRRYKPDDILLQKIRSLKPTGKS
jgi:hypothetical protein